MIGADCDSWRTDMGSVLAAAEAFPVPWMAGGCEMADAQLPVSPQLCGICWSHCWSAHHQGHHLWYARKVILSPKALKLAYMSIQNPDQSITRYCFLSPQSISIFQ